MKVVAVVQARMSSMRLPGKSLAMLSGKPSLQWIIERVKPAKALSTLAVATSDLPADEPIVSLCAKLDVPCYRGSEKDVLGRMWTAASDLKADVLVRLTGDNPFVNHELVDGAVDRFVNASPRFDYLNTSDAAGWPIGLMVEVIAMSALRQSLHSSQLEDREHVTWFVRQRPAAFLQGHWRSPFPFPQYRLTIDTADDYERAAALYERLLEINPDFGMSELWGLLASPTRERDRSS